MNRRRDPVRISDVLPAVVGGVEPQTALARVQSAWQAAAGSTLAKWAEPVSERAGVVTLACSDSMVAHELEMMRSELLEKLAAELAESPPRELRFVIR